MNKNNQSTNSLLNIEKLIKDFNLPVDAIKTTKLDIEELRAIYDEHKSRFDDLENVGSSIAGQLRRARGVHSLKYRVKDPEHLIAKIIRKRLQEASRFIGIGNYKDEISDLVGIRALHLFKEDWQSIHDYVTTTWNIQGKPVANIREGDSEKWTSAYKKLGCDICPRDAGYRSVHYLIQSQPTKFVHIVELQVRTLFEEGWSEVDHCIRYPHDLNNPVLAPLLFIFNRLAGSADEVASYIVWLQAEMQSIEEQHLYVLEERDKQVKELQVKIEALPIEADAKEQLKESIESINTFDLAITTPSQASVTENVRRPLTPRERLPRSIVIDPAWSDSMRLGATLAAFTAPSPFSSLIADMERVSRSSKMIEMSLSPYMEVTSGLSKMVADMTSFSTLGNIVEKIAASPPNPPMAKNKPSSNDKVEEEKKSKD